MLLFCYFNLRWTCVVILLFQSTLDLCCYFAYNEIMNGTQGTIENYEKETINTSINTSSDYNERVTLHVTVFVWRHVHYLMFYG